MSVQFRKKHAQRIREASANGEIWTCKFCGKQKPAGEFSNYQLELCLDCYSKKAHRRSKNGTLSDSSKPQADTFTERNSKSTEVDAESILQMIEANWKTYASDLRHHLKWLNNYEYDREFYLRIRKAIREFEQDLKRITEKEIPNEKRSRG